MPSYSAPPLPGIEPEPLTTKERRKLSALEATLAKHLPEVMYLEAVEAFQRCSEDERAALLREFAGEAGR